MMHRDSLVEERSKSLYVFLIFNALLNFITIFNVSIIFLLFREFKERLTFCESKNLSLRHRVNELEMLLKITSDQNCVTNPSSQRNSNENLIRVQVVDISQVINLILELIMEISLFLTYSHNIYILPIFLHNICI